MSLEFIFLCGGILFIELLLLQALEILWLSIEKGKNCGLFHGAS